MPIRYRKIIYEFFGSSVLSLLLFACIILSDYYLKSYRTFSGEPILVVLIILGFPASNFLGFFIIDKFFFVVESISKVRFVFAIIVSSVISGFFCALILDYVKLSSGAKASMLIFTIIIFSLIFYNLFSVTVIKKKRGR